MKPSLVLLFLFGFFLVVPNSVLAAPIVPGSFSTTWDNSGGDGDPNDPVVIVLGECADTVYWEEIGNEANNGTSFNCVSDGGEDTEVAFPSSGAYRVDYSGNFTRIYVYGANRGYFRTVEQWGDSVWNDLVRAFQNVTDLTFNATDIPNLTSVTSLERMFSGATNFNSPIDNWDVSQVTILYAMFQDATSFNQPLHSWDVSNVNYFGCYGECGYGMFQGATSFNQDISGWDVSSAVDLSYMFQGATSFNQDISGWDVSNVEGFTSMFEDATSFNQPIGSWSIAETCLGVAPDNRFFVWQWLVPQASACINGSIFMYDMFSGATAFNQALGSWNVSNVTQMTNMFDNSGLSPENYSATLNGWAGQVARNNVTLGAAGLSSLENATTARQSLIDIYSWTINDAGLYVEPGSQTFITRWDTSLDPSTPSELNFYLSDGASAFTIDWGDGTTQYYATGPDDYVSHTYSTPGIKTVTITGNFPYFYAGCWDGDEYNKLIDVAQWGAGQWESLVSSFGGCTHLEDFSATDVPDLSLVVDMSDAFAGASSFNSDLSDWDVSNVIDMSRMFNDAAAFNNDIGAWDVSNVGGMQSMFNGATSFNQDISDWRPSPGDMLALFSGAVNFNSDISAWDVSGVAQLNAIFMGSALSTSNYTKLLLGWSTQVLPDALASGPIGGTYDADLDDYVDLTPYCTLAQGARDIITGTYNWTMTDGGPVDCQTVTYQVEGSGSIDGESFQYVVDGESGTAVTAVPAAGYRFTGWSDGSTANPRTDGNLTSALVMTAIFAANGGSESTKVGERAKQLAEAIKTMPVVGSVAKFVSSVHDFLMYLTNNEDKLEQLSTEERTVIIVALRDILAFLLRLVPGF